MNYYGRFYRSQCVQVLQYLNKVLAAWARRLGVLPEAGS